MEDMLSSTLWGLFGVKNLLFFLSFFGCLKRKGMLAYFFQKSFPLNFLLFLDFSLELLKVNIVAACSKLTDVLEN